MLTSYISLLQPTQPYAYNAHIIKIELADDSVTNVHNKSDVTSFNKRVALSVVLVLDFFM